MIKKLNLENESALIREFVRKDSARNYFIRLAFENKSNVYTDIYHEIDGNGNIIGALFRRKSGNLQFYGDDNCDFYGFSEIIKNLEFHSLIGPSSYCDKLNINGLFQRIKEGAFISKLNFKLFDDRDDFSKCRNLNICDLDEIVEIYESVFKNFSSKETMKIKLENKRGRGIVLESDNKIISVAQSEFEESNSSLIVGVATRKDFMKKGYASKCLKRLIADLSNEGKDIFLQYDNLDAGKIYKQLGFEVIDRVKFYYKK